MEIYGNNHYNKERNAKKETFNSLQECLSWRVPSSKPYSTEDPL
ncbi:hypothetical protein AVEN_205842-1, partial [Araneus ventricosus]